MVTGLTQGALDTEPSCMVHSVFGFLENYLHISRQKKLWAFSPHLIQLNKRKLGLGTVSRPCTFFPSYTAIGMTDSYGLKVPSGFSILLYHLLPLAGIMEHLAAAEPLPALPQVEFREQRTRSRECWPLWG